MSDNKTSVTGIAIASIIILLWLLTLVIYLTADISTMPLSLVVIGVLSRSFLQTGLFITTHEAIHQSIAPQRQVNNCIGRITSCLYAFLSYRVLSENHQKHHRYPATERDPDFSAEKSHNWLLWYFSFMQEYQKEGQFWLLFTGMTIVFWIFIELQISLLNIILFWLIPIFISSMQLFFFGIFLPHRKSSTGYSDWHRARSSNYSVFWSFITCYHFGYHWEHHQYPNIPWYKLPSKRLKNKNISIKNQFCDLSS